MGWDTTYSFRFLRVTRRHNTCGTDVLCFAFDVYVYNGHTCKSDITNGNYVFDSLLKAPGRRGLACHGRVLSVE